jgi:hypothetical protein
MKKNKTNSCKHSWESEGVGIRYCAKCDTLQIRKFNGSYINMQFYWETV